MAEFKFHIAPLRNASRIFDSLRNVRENPPHLLLRLQIKLVVGKSHAVRVADEGARLNAQQNVVKFGILLLYVVDVVRRHEADARLIAQALQQRIDGGFLLQTLILNLQEEVSFSKYIEIFQSLRFRTLVIAPRQRLLHPSGQTGAGGDDSAAVSAQQFIVDPRFIIKAFRITTGDYFDQIPVSLVRFRQENQMSRPLVALRILVEARARRRVDLAADDRLDPGFFRRTVKIHDAEHRAVVRNREGVHAQLRRPRHQRLDARGSVQQAVFRMNV